MESKTYEHLAAVESTVPASDSSVNTAPKDSAAIRRLLDEVRCEELTQSSAATAYNRQHNRHNR